MRTLPVHDHRVSVPESNATSTYQENEEESPELEPRDDQRRQI